MESTKENINSFLEGLEYLIYFSYVDDMEVFDTCLEYWTIFTKDVYNSTQIAYNKGKEDYYASILENLRKIMIKRMAKPEEVLFFIFLYFN